MKCPYCSEKIKKDYKICPHCGVDLNHEEEPIELPETDDYRKGFMDGIRFMKEFIEQQKAENKVIERIETPQIIKIIREKEISKPRIMREPHKLKKPYRSPSRPHRPRKTYDIKWKTSKSNNISTWRSIRK